MGKSVERNDVDITKLFRYEKEVEIKDEISQKSGKFYLRIIGDADMNRARVFGLRESSRLRKALKDPTSFEREAFISELPEFKSDEILVQAILLLATAEIHREAVNNTDVPEPKLPKGDAPLKELEKYQEEVDGWGDKYNHELDKTMRKLQRKEQKRLEKFERDDLYAIYEGYIIDRLCSEEMSTKYYSNYVYLGTYADPKYKKRAFTNFDEYDNASSHLKDRLTEQYRLLEVGMDELKKLPGATPS